MEEYKTLLAKVKSVLDDDEAIEKILSEYPNKDLNMAGLSTEVEYQTYLDALATCQYGYSILLERDIDERYVNSYNPEWVRAWNGNTDLQVCLDYFAVITYITEYYTKDDSGTMTLLLKALQEADCETLKEKMIMLMNTFISARQMGETEAFFKIFPDFHLKDSNVTTVFVPVGKKENRSKYLMKIEDGKEFGGKEKLKIEGRDGYYVEKYDLISKYERCREQIEDLSFSHFAKMFHSSWKYKDDKSEVDSSSKSDCEEDEGLAEEEKDSKFNYVMKCFGGPDHTNCKYRKTV
jgi:hypothetical protein